MLKQLKRFYRTIKDKRFNTNNVYKCQLLVNDTIFVTLAKEMIIEQNKEAEGFSQIAKDMKRCEREKRGAIGVLKKVLNKYYKGDTFDIKDNLARIIEDLEYYENIYSNDEDSDNQGVYEETLISFINKFKIINDAYSRPSDL